MAGYDARLKRLFHRLEGQDQIYVRVIAQGLSNARLRTTGEVEGRGWSGRRGEDEGYTIVLTARKLLFSLGSS